ncbi:hypothetical protein T01_7920 [Trichinella spiralis]|uniref:Uncharacterized protein n=1 Tax=Trichinella spiralis TaxID=6334 RepID=A0A0V1BDF5_TRISP|nr:hypothetical protein T01_7920 [Trichinella spiralis]
MKVGGKTLFSLTPATDEQLNKERCFLWLLSNNTSSNKRAITLPISTGNFHPCFSSQLFCNVVETLLVHCITIMPDIRVWISRQKLTKLMEQLTMRCQLLHWQQNMLRFDTNRLRLGDFLTPLLAGKGHMV